MSKRFALYSVSFCFLLLVSLFISCAVKPKVSPIAKTITIFYTGDLNLNNIARIATIVKQEKTKNPNLFIIDGKIFSEEPITVLNRGEAEISILNSAGIDGIILTPDFFRFGTQRAKELIDKVEFFFLAANLYQSNQPKFFAQGYLIKNLAKTRVSLIGLLLDSTNFYLKLPGVERRDPVYTTKLYVPMQRMRESDLVGLAVTRADSITFSDLDFVIGADTARSIAAPPCNKDEILRRLDLFLGSNNQIIDYNNSVMTINDSITEDSLVKATLEKYWERTDSMLDTKITETKKDFDVKSLTDIVYQVILNETNADGIIDQPLLVAKPISKGSVTFRSLFEALNIKENLPIVALSGKALSELAAKKLEVFWLGKLNQPRVFPDIDFAGIVTTPDLISSNPECQNTEIMLTDSTLVSMVANYLKKGGK